MRSLPRPTKHPQGLCRPPALVDAATKDYWGNDQAGAPLFVLAAAANAGLLKMLPEVLSQVRRFAGDRRVTVVFDRGGWSPKLFQKLLAANFDLLTYRKSTCRRIAAHRFLRHRAQIDGRTVEYRLHDKRSAS